MRVRHGVPVEKPIERIGVSQMLRRVQVSRHADMRAEQEDVAHGKIGALAERSTYANEIEDAVH